jgi:phosphatidylserine/phosphatidylglycerophosphate/cardiolipin synthase-like enzyme
MSTNFFDVLLMWLGSGPSSPKYCQIVGSKATRFLQFGEEVAGVPSDLLDLAMNDIGTKAAAPTNALVWHVPNLTDSTLTPDEKAQVRAIWPPLRKLSGAPFTPEDARGDGTLDALLLEVFPSAYRRLEYLFSSLEIPASKDDWDIPRTPTPRWFWIWGFGETGIRNRFQAIADQQFAGHPSPTITRFMKGLSPIYVDAGETLDTFEDDDHIQVRAFDSTGLPIDPDFVFATFNRLADDSDFGRLKVDHPEGLPTPYVADGRCVIVFCDQAGNPYTPRPAPLDPPSPTDPEAGTVEAERHLFLLSPGAGDFSFPEHGVLTFPDHVGLGDAEGPVGLAMTGTHVRFGPYPDGDIGATITVDFAPKMFLRLQVLDYRDWFQKNPNPRNRLTRYTEGNLLTPLVDGAPFFRELYRTIRSTYKTIDLQLPPASFDPDASVGDASAAEAARAKVFLSNAWIDPHTPLLGRRGMLAAPKTQDVAPEDLPAFDDLMAKVRCAAAPGLPGLVDVSAMTIDQLKWWMVSEDGVLPPGASVELRQLIFADQFHGDDPRLPGEELNADIFGIVAPFPGEAASSRAFVSSTGRFVLPVVFAVGRDPKAMLRVTVWPPNQPEPLTHTYGQILLPAPPDPTHAPPFTGPAHPAGLHLVYEGVPGTAVVVIDKNALVTDCAVVVLNARSGEAVVENHIAFPPAEIRIALTSFALQDSALVGFLGVGESDPAACTHFFELYLGKLPEVPESAIDAQNADPSEGPAATLLAGAAPAHPTELTGLLREAITAGVDVRVLGWRDPTQDTKSALLSTLGTVNSVNAVFGGKRGQAIWDATSRETFHVHHQKGAFIRTANGSFIGFLGGTDILNGRWDTHAHRQPDPERPSSTWHDVQCKVEGKAAWDIYRNFMQRWNAANALPDIVGADAGRTPLPPPDDPSWGSTPVVDDPTLTKADGPHAVQINRTLAPHFDAYGGSAPPFDIVDPITGDLSVRNTWQHLLNAAEQYVYIEEQYFWIGENALTLNQWLRARPDRFMFLLMPRRFSDVKIADQMHYALRRRRLNQLLYGVEVVPHGTDPATLPNNVEARLAMFHIVSRETFDPIYVHSKLVIADDTWFTIGSANLSRRSWTFDSEINAACIDKRVRRGGHVSARELRIDLLAEHLQLQPVERPLIDDPRDAFRMVKEVLADKRQWMRTHLLKVDLNFTHYGPFPDDFDPFMLDAANLIADTDGVQTQFELRLIDAVGFFEALRDGTSGLRYGGVGRLRFVFDVSAIGANPSTVSVRVKIGDLLLPESQHATMGPFPADTEAEAGVLRIGRDYAVRATAFNASTSAFIKAAPDQLVHPTEFVTTVSIVF